MMRSLYSGVSGLKSHQTRMDVIGNNIANVNTTAYKSKSLNFSDMLYQTTQSATGATAVTGGTNARQIGLGVKTAAINASITTEGSSQSTGNPFDLKLTGECFFVVSDGTNTYYTRDGSFDVDDAGNLVMSSTGYIVQGWGVDSDGNIVQGSVSNLNLYSKSTYDPEATSAATVSGIIDNNDSNLETTTGKIFNLQIYDALGYEYNLQFGILPQTRVSTSYYDIINTENEYTLQGTLYRVDTSDLSYVYTNYDDDNVTGTATLTTTDQPEILNAVNDFIARYLADTSEETITVNGNGLTVSDILDADNYTLGSESTITVTLTAGFLNAYELSTLENGDITTNTVITVTFSGDTGYITETTHENESWPYSSDVVSTIDDSAIALFYTVDNGDSTKYTLNTDPDMSSVTSIKQTYENEDGDSITEYVFRDNSGNAITVTSDLYSEVLKILNLGDKSTTQVTYTTQESKETSSTVAGSFTLTLLGMTETSSGKEVDISTLLNNGTTSWDLVYNTDNGNFSYVGSDGEDSFTLTLSAIDTKFSNVVVNMTDTTNVDNNGSSTVTALKDDGRKVGTLSGVSIGTDGLITATYSNGMTATLGQICVATFQNAMGLSGNGDNLYMATSASGDSTIVDIAASGTGYMTTGVLEMSNVDLSTEFTNLITTQRGFQANSRIITVSDTMLEELVNLKR